MRTTTCPTGSLLKPEAGVTALSSARVVTLTCAPCFQQPGLFPHRVVRCPRHDCTARPAVKRSPNRAWDGAQPPLPSQPLLPAITPNFQRKPVACIQTHRPLQKAAAERFLYLRLCAARCRQVQAPPMAPPPAATLGFSCMADGKAFELGSTGFLELPQSLPAVDGDLLDGGLLAALDGLPDGTPTDLQASWPGSCSKGGLAICTASRRYHRAVMDDA
jgi:hypothetical protein